MVEDEDLLSTLRIAHRNKTGFACRDASDCDQISVESLTHIPLEDAFYYVGGTTTGTNGLSVESVIYLDTRGEVFAVYYLVNEVWYSQSEDELYEELGVERTDFFPVEYDLAIPLEYDGPLT